MSTWSKYEHFNSKNELNNYIQEYEEAKYKKEKLHEEFKKIKRNDFGINSKLVTFYSKSDEIASREFKELNVFHEIHSLEEVKAEDAILMRYVPFAELMEEEVKYNSGNVIVDSQQKEYLSDIRNWYKDLKDFTPKTWENFDGVDEAGPYFCKGEDKSLKIDFWKYCYAEDKKKLKETITNLEVALPGNQQIIIRKFTPLKNYGNSPSTGMPISHEFRSFVFMGEVASTGFYWEEFAHEYGINVEDNIPPENFLNEVINKVGTKANYYTIDTALTEDGEWIIIELNSGAQAGLSGINPKEHYKNMQKIWNKL